MTALPISLKSPSLLVVSRPWWQRWWQDGWARLTGAAPGAAGIAYTDLADADLSPYLRRDIGLPDGPSPWQGAVDAARWDLYRS